MSMNISFTDRLLAVVIPTRAQTLAAIGVSLGILIVGHSQSILSRLGVPQTFIDGAKSQFDIHLNVILQTNIASQAAIITFWAVIGLVAYLICWGAYNALIEARNEVTLNTAYTNRGHWRGPWETLGLKAVMAIGLGLSLAAIGPGLTYWVLTAGRFITDPSVTTGLFGLLSILATAVQLYAVLAFAQLTFMPWYRAETFTES